MPHESGRDHADDLLLQSMQVLSDKIERAGSLAPVQRPSAASLLLRKLASSSDDRVLKRAETIFSRVLPIIIKDRRIYKPDEKQLNTPREILLTLPAKRIVLWLDRVLEKIRAQRR